MDARDDLDASIAFDAAWEDDEDSDGEAHLWWLMANLRCIRCESPNTEDVTGEYDAVQVRRCFDCGYRYANEL